MFDAIKNLKPAHRFQAFLFVVILSTLTSITTAYMSTDDCSGMANQYNTLIKNYTETLSLNNQLVADNNQKQKDFMLIKKMLDSLANIGPEISKKTTVKNNKVNQIVYNDQGSGSNGVSLDTIAVSSPLEIRQIDDNKIITTETTVIKIGNKQKDILGKVYEVVKKHEKQ
jgi:hypothetical protein